ncbi:cache domain-containing protein [Thermosynechococcus sp. PP45]|uniref:cache domain-containing protein n=1 Tax=unclassified Thermosynechococcus TaxID=2622553 RepID=UPI0026720CCE|nr:MULTISPECIES: cache domain-containing protein [unclassified Thermosynechococcus]MDR5638764.1 cache domain-containing protein [Thermosynechococcus sp. PP42]WKT80632.1 cache domain-containing protein [Thermosynechococcus sp. PP45]WNC24244.1 cache domain-containing protein [Thermosynechococcus sp. PP551]WNC26822.1 cache domain-containing protein [Thermosynechococcus sp. PP555]WNC59775.1 cache domain-containing protein [Thermosynechococcus sp. QS41]
MLRWRQGWSRLLWSISGRLLLVMLLISLLPMGMVVLYNQTESAEMMKRWEIDALQLLAISKARSLDQLFQDALNDALLVANDSDVQYFLRRGSHSAIEQATMNNFLEDVKNLNPAYYQVILLNRDGQAIAGTRRTRLGLDYKNTPLWQQSATADYFISRVKINSAITEQPLFVVFQTIIDSNNERLGAVLLPLQATAVKDIVTYLVPDIHGESFLIDDHGLILSTTNPYLNLHSIEPLPPEIRDQYFLLTSPQPIPTVADRSYTLRNVFLKAKSKEVGALLASRSSGGDADYIYAYAPLTRHQGVVVVSVRLSEFLAPLERLATQGFLSLFFVGVGVILISLIVARSITKPIRALVSAAHALKHDQFNEFNPRVLRHYAQGSDDMAELAQVFLDMAQAVEQRQDQLKEELSELKIEIDQEKRKKSVAEITSTDYFQELRQRAQQLRQRAHTQSPTPATHPQIGHTEGEARKDEPPLPT